MASGYIDTNVFVHALTHDLHAVECQQFLKRVEHGEVQVRLDVTMLHELSFLLKRWPKEKTKQQIGDLLLTILNWPGIEAGNALLSATVKRWQVFPSLAFVDAYLIERALLESVPVYSKDVKDLLGHGVDVPDPLPDGID